MSIKGLFYFDLDLLECRSKRFSTSIWIVEMSIKGLFYVNQRAFLLRFGLAGMSIIGLFYFDLDCWNVDQRASLLLSELVVKMLIKGIFHFDLECWNVDQRASLLSSYCCQQKVKMVKALWSHCFFFFFLDVWFSFVWFELFHSYQENFDFFSSLKKILFLKLEAWN